HDVKQTEPLQAKSPHEVVVPTVQLPVPLQLPLVGMVHVPGPAAQLQEAAPQETLDPTTTQDPLAVQRPVLVMHGLALVVVGHIGSVVPTTTFPQVPIALPPVARLQAWQARSQVLLQHTPSTQN